MLDDTGPARADRGSPQVADAGRPALLVSACLLGVRCNHRGEANTVPGVVALRSRYRIVPVCPETAGGLPTPRTEARRQPDGRVVDATGADVTEWFHRGADHAVRLAVAAGAREAVLKARSPSCGCGQIYDGSFTKRLVDGDGVAAEALRAAGVTVRTEDDATEL